MKLVLYDCCLGFQGLFLIISFSTQPRYSSSLPLAPPGSAQHFKELTTAIGSLALPPGAEGALAVWSIPAQPSDYCGGLLLCHLIIYDWSLGLQML